MLGITRDDEAETIADLARDVFARLDKPRQALQFPEKVPHTTNVVRMDGRAGLLPLDGRRHRHGTELGEHAN